MIRGQRCDGNAEMTLNPIYGHISTTEMTSNPVYGQAATAGMNETQVYAEVITRAKDSENMYTEVLPQPVVHTNVTKTTAKNESSDVLATWREILIKTPLHLFIRRLFLSKM